MYVVGEAKKIKLVVPFRAAPASAGPGVGGVGVHRDKPWEGWGWILVRDDSSAIIGGRSHYGRRNRAGLFKAATNNDISVRRKKNLRCGTLLVLARADSHVAGNCACSVVTSHNTAKIDSKYDELRSPWHSCRAELVRCTEFHGETRSPFDSVTYKARSTCVTV